MLAEPRESQAQVNQIYRCSNGREFTLYSERPGDTRQSGYAVELQWNGKKYKLTTTHGASMVVLKGNDGYEVILWRYAAIRQDGKVLATECHWK